jgi:copper oxidase (laccase) domain-containing protein
MDDTALAYAMGSKDYAALDQVHGNRIVRVEESIARNEKADGMITNCMNIVLQIRSADCQTFLAFAPTERVLGVLHVGWKGLLCDAIPAFFRSLEAWWGIPGQETVVCGGPSLCMECSEFQNPQEEFPGIPEEFFSGRLVDLRSIAEEQLFQCGVVAKNFERMEGCTCCDTHTYWSYRGGDREKVLKGKTNVLACMLV